MTRYPEQNTFKNLVKAHELYWGECARFLKEHGLTIQQYNVIRILEQQTGAGRPHEEGLPMLSIAERLINRVPDITRLIDRMERHALVMRVRSQEDRRVVLVSLTEKGKRLASLNDELLAFHADQFEHMSVDELATLNSLLEKAVKRSGSSACG